MQAFDVQVSGAGIVGKTLALSLARLGLSDWVLPAGGLQAPVLAALLVRALDDDQALRQALQRRLPAVRARALRAVELSVAAGAPQRAP